MNKLITVNSRKYDGSLHRTWDCELVSFDGKLIEARGVFTETVEHPHLGTIEAGVVSFERFWLSRWYNLFRFETVSGELRNHYFNVSMPPKFSNNAIEFVDLDLDLVVWPDGRAEALDEAEFLSNAKLYQYPDHVIEKALSTLDQIKRDPFSHDQIR